MWLISGSLFVGLTGCSGSVVPGGAAEVGTTTAAPTTAGATPTPEVRQTPHAPLAVSTTQVNGRRRRTSYALTLPVFAGPLAAQIDRLVRRSAEDGVAAFADDADDVDSDVEVKATVPVDDGRTVQVHLDYLFYARGAAHPVDGVSTVVLRRADARPVLLTDVFFDPRQALDVALQHATEVAASTGEDDPTGSLTTDVQDWADWQSGPAGLSFSFDDGRAGSHAAGLREVDVPWALIRTWTRDDAYALLGPT